MKLSFFQNTILLIFVLNFLGCESEDTGTRTLFATISEDSTFVENLSSDTTAITARIKRLNDFFDAEEDVYASKNRDLWQQPQTIINYLGDLHEKTLADIGAGPNGYFTFIIATRTSVGKIIAIDIDKDALKYIDDYKGNLNEIQGNKIETRLVSPSDPQLKDEEVDFILVSNTLTYISDRLEYLQKLRKGLSKNGQILIIDSKMKKLPEIFPSREFRMPLFEMEELIEKAGFTHILSDDLVLNYQYIILAKK